jgi:hypothetical protein
MIKPSITIDDATDDDVARFYPGTQINGNWIAKVFRKGSLVAAFGGFLDLGDGVWFAFLDVPAYLRKPMLYRHVVHAFSEVKARGARIIRAHCDSRIPGAEKLMRHMGFVQTDESYQGVCVWELDMSERMNTHG